MCEWGNMVAVNLRVTAGISCTGRTRHVVKHIDSCIAQLVKDFNRIGLVTIASCCGHGKRPGSIVLADGRHFEILPDRETWEAVQEAYKKAGLFEPSALEARKYSPA